MPYSIYYSNGRIKVRRKVYTIFLLIVLLCIQDAALTKAETVYKESLTLDVAIFKTMKCYLDTELSVTTPNGPFDASEFTSDPEFNSFYVFCYLVWGGDVPVDASGSPIYNITFCTDVQVYVNGIEFAPTLHGLRIAEALNSKIENMFNIVLTYFPERIPAMGIPYTDLYSFISNVSVVDQFWDIFKTFNFPGFSQLFTSNANIEAGGMELSLEKIDGSFLWTYKIRFGLYGPPRIEFGQEYTLSLNDILNRSEDISSALGSSASNVRVEFWMGNENWTFVPLGVEPIMTKSQDDVPRRIVFSTDIAGSRITDIKIRFKIIEKPENYLAMYVTVVLLGAFSSAVGYYLVKRHRIRSSSYGL